MPIFYLESASPDEFPDPELADAGLLAVGADLDPSRLLAAYDRGIFPWFSEDEVPLWWSPDPRAVLEPDELHVPRRLARTIRKGELRLTWNHDFARVIRECGKLREDGTWIHRAMIRAYEGLHALGAAHSLEVWREDRMVGGLYGVQRGGLFAAESKFFRERDASKLALVAAVRCLQRAGIELFDVQFQTGHLEQFGVREWPRRRYLDELARVRSLEVDLSELDPRLDDCT